MSQLHEMLQGITVKGVNGPINLHERMTAIKKESKTWLCNLDKNGYEHSERLEEYLDSLTQQARQKGLLLPQEVFLLICGVYMHDLGYWVDGHPEPKDHPARSRDLLLKTPDAYLLGDFPCIRGSPPRVAEVVGWVCYGHSEEIFLPLAKVPNDFPDQALCNEPLNLRKLAALLRLADEADDPYMRPGKHPIRTKTPLVSVGEETIAWHWKDAGTEDPAEFLAHLNNKHEILATSVDYLRDVGLGHWFLVLDPQVVGSVPFMAEGPVETFVGRIEALKEMHRILRERGQGAITGVVGTGGIGKTELAKRYAQEYRGEYPGGVFWASLKGSDWRTQAQRILEQLRPWVQPPAFPDEGRAKEEIKKALGRRGALLIIDNVTEADQIINPDCFLLVTSRDKGAFGIIPHNVLHKLPGLSTEEGKELLAKILGAERVQQDVRGAERIVEILGGMPLAVEIAAQHLADVPHKGFPEYIGEIEGKVSALVLKDLPDKDVAASLELSLEQLQGLEKGAELVALFEAMSACAAAGFTAQTLAAAAGLQGAEDLVGKLHSRSLLEFDSASGRYGTHPLMRQLAEVRLHRDEKRAASFRENHCLYFLEYARGHTANQLIAERDGLWQAMTQANQLGRSEELLPQFVVHLSWPYQELLKGRNYEAAFWYLVRTNLGIIHQLGQSRLSVGLLEPLLKERGSLADYSQGGLLISLGNAHYWLGEHQKALQFYEQALEVCRRIGDARGGGIILNNMGNIYDHLGEYRKALQHHRQALDIARGVGDAQGEGNALGNMGLVYFSLGKYDKALQLFERHLQIARRIGDLRGEGNALGNMGLVHLSLGKYDKALQYYEKALETYCSIGDLQGESATLASIGNVYDDMGECQKAFQYYEKALEIHRGIGDLRGESADLVNMGIFYKDLGDYMKALQLYEEALGIHRSIGDLQGESADLVNIGNVYNALGKHQKALDLHEEALEIARKIGDARGEGNALGSMGLVYFSLGKYDKALQFLEQDLQIARRIGDLRGEGGALNNMGLAQAALGDKKKARQCFEASKAIFQRLGLDHMVQRVEENIKKL